MHVFYQHLPVGHPDRQKKAVEDIRYHMGDEAFGEVTKLFLKYTRDSMPFEKFKEYCKTAGISGYLVEAWYEELFGRCSGKKCGQREFMRGLVKQLGQNQKLVCATYSQAERDGIVERKNNATGLSAENYAIALWKDGLKKGWLT
ncbi:MAG: hypothetical protein ABIN69_05125 [Aestuariivirga sp.]